MTPETPLRYNPVTVDGSIVKAITLIQLENMCDRNPSLRGYLHGYIAEVKLEESISQIEGVEKVEKIQDRDKQKGDFLVSYLGQEITIEAKSLRSSKVIFDPLSESWRAPVVIKASGAQDILLETGQTVRTTSLRPGKFDILAINCFAATGSWDFLFMKETLLPRNNRTGLLSTSFTVDPSSTPGVTQNLKRLFDQTLDKRLVSN